MQNHSARARSAAAQRLSTERVGFGRAGSAKFIKSHHTSSPVCGNVTYHDHQPTHPEFCDSHQQKRNIRVSISSSYPRFPVALPAANGFPQNLVTMHGHGPADRQFIPLSSMLPPHGSGEVSGTYTFPPLTTPFKGIPHVFYQPPCPATTP